MEIKSLLMRFLKTDTPHIPVSIACYLACLLFPAYYIGEQYEPQLGMSLLLIGWLGPLDGHFAWFANPLFLLSLRYSRKPIDSSAMGFISLALAISFLFYEKIIVSEAPTYSPIVAYGWGFGLWVASLAILSFGQLFRAFCLKSKYINAAAFSAGSLILLGYITYYFIGANSLHAIWVERNRAFEALCASAGEQIYRRSTDTKSIFFDPDWQWNIGIQYGGNSSFKSITNVGVIGDSHLNSGHLLFFETKDRDVPNGYIKHIFGANGRTKSNQLESEYAVTTEFLNLPIRLNISGATVTIKDRRNDSIMAKSTFVLAKDTGKFCGNPSGEFSTSRFVMDVLGLTSKYPTTIK